jgi:oxazoline/thiazoline dehydrogenase
VVRSEVDDQSGAITSAVPILLRLAPGVRFTLATRSMSYSDGRARIVVHDSPRGVIAVLTRLARGGASENRLRCASSRLGITAIASLQQILDAFDRFGFLVYEMRLARHLQARLQAASLPPRYTAPCTLEQVGFTLSPFASIRRDSVGTYLESAVTGAMFRLYDRRLATTLIRSLFEEAPRDSSHRANELGDPLRVLLARAGLLAGTEDSLPALAYWERIDLEFHRHSRLAGKRPAYGATYPFLGSALPLPAQKPATSNDWVALPPPQTGPTEQPLRRVLEARRSIRVHGRRPVTLMDLSTFLHRAARVQRVIPPRRAAPYEQSERPSPSGGGCHALELYLIVARCDGLEPGLYRYDPFSHRLERASPARTSSPEQVIRALVPTPMLPRRPHILIVLSARFARVSWKYRGIAYATILKDVGALLQTMYLVATDLGLAPCALGGGDSRVFASLTGLSELEEASVGEFLLGRPPRGQSNGQ